MAGSGWPLRLPRVLKLLKTCSLLLVVISLLETEISHERRIMFDGDRLRNRFNHSHIATAWVKIRVHGGAQYAAAHSYVHTVQQRLARTPNGVSARPRDAGQSLNMVVMMFWWGLAVLVPLI